MAIFSRLATTIGYIFALQLGAAAVFVPLHTEVRKVVSSVDGYYITITSLNACRLHQKYYDLFGSLGFLSASFVSLYTPWLRARWSGEPAPLPPLSSHAPRQLLLTGSLILWSGRLGYFLFNVRVTPLPHLKLRT